MLGSQADLNHLVDHCYTLLKDTESASLDPCNVRKFMGKTHNYGMCFFMLRNKGPGCAGKKQGRPGVYYVVD